MIRAIGLRDAGYLGGRAIDAALSSVRVRFVANGTVGKMR